MPTTSARCSAPGGAARSPRSAASTTRARTWGTSCCSARALERINLTYEAVDLKLSYDLPWGFRVYGGGGFLFDQEPESLKPWSVQGGVEFRSPRTFARGYIRPVMAVDLQTREENNWNLDVSVRGGIQLENVRVLERNLQLLLEYFNGNSPDGQFYKRRVEYLGMGAHFHF